MATPFTHTSLQTTLARPGQSGSGKTSSPATIGTRDPGMRHVATLFTHTGPQRTLAKPGQSGSGKARCPLP